MRKSASEIIRNLESRIARLERSAATRYRTRTVPSPSGEGFIEEPYPVKPTFSERVFNNTFEGLFEKALKRKGAKNINLTFDADKKSFTHMSEFHGVNVYKEDIKSFPVYSVGEGKLFFMLDGQPYEFPFYLQNTYNERQMALEIIAGNGKSHNMDLGKVLVVQYDWHEMDVVLSRNFDRVIEIANEKYYGKRFARLERKASNIDMKTIKKYFGDVGEIRYHDEVSNNRILLDSRAVNDILKEILKIAQDCIVNGTLDEDEFTGRVMDEIGEFYFSSRSYGPDHNAQDELYGMVEDFVYDAETIIRTASRSKYARSIPRPPRNTITELLTVDRATKISDKALDAEYGYGLSKPGSFGYEANKYSSMYALGAIADNLNLMRKNPEDKKLIEIVADAVHDGWSYAAYNVDDPRYQTQPEKRDNRIALADASYRSLSEGEKEKDRVIARALLLTVYMADKR